MTAVEQHTASDCAIDLGPAATAARIIALSQWINSGPTYVGLDFETRGWRRVSKIVEEDGEVTEAWLGTIGENQRKGKHKTIADVVYELLDVAASALGATDNLGGDVPIALDRLSDGLHHTASSPAETEADVWRRLGLVTDLVGKVSSSWLAAISIHQSTGGWVVADVVERLSEVAAAALDAVEHLTDQPGQAITLFASHVAYVHGRAGLNRDG